MGHGTVPSMEVFSLQLGALGSFPGEKVAPGLSEQDRVSATLCSSSEGGQPLLQQMRQALLECSHPPARLRSLPGSVCLQGLLIQ